MHRTVLSPIACASLTLILSTSCQRPTPTAPAPRDAAVVAAVNRGVAQMGQYDFTAAVETFSTLAATHPADAGVGLNLALARINRQAEGDAAEAERALAALAGDATIAVRAKYALGLLRLYGGREGEALPLLTEVAASAPADPYPAYFAGQARLGTAPEEALTWFAKAQAIDSSLRSTFYGSFQALQRLGRTDEAARMLARFQTLERDPRAHMAEFKYTRMGPLAMAVTLDSPDGTSAPSLPALPVVAFAAARPVPFPVQPQRSAEPGAITVADVDGDGEVDLFLANALAGDRPNAVLFHDRRLELDHPLSRVRGVRSALWGDIDDDGLVDVVLLGNGTTAIWRQSPAGRWRDVTAAMRALSPAIDAVDGALVDADHDGDLDIWLVNGRGANELLNNDGNGTFRRIAAQAGLAADRRPSRGLAVADLDGDRDHDLVVLKATPPHEVFLNDRVWQYAAGAGVRAIHGSPARRRCRRRPRCRRPGRALHVGDTRPRAVAARRPRQLEPNGHRASGRLVRTATGRRGCRRRRWARSAGQPRRRVGGVVDGGAGDVADQRPVVVPGPQLGGRARGPVAWPVRARAGRCRTD